MTDYGGGLNADYDWLCGSLAAEFGGVGMVVALVVGVRCRQMTEQETTE